jgi:hypothetical protein
MSLYIKGVTASLGYQQITSLSAAAGLSVPSDPSKPPATMAVIIPEGQTVRWRDDGVSPTALVGMPLIADAALVYGGDLTSIRFIETVSGAKLNVSYYATATPTPTPTPTPSPSSAIAFDADSEQFEVINTEVGTSWEWRTLEPGASPSSGDPVVSGATGTTLAISELEVEQGAYNVPDGTWARHSNVLYRIPAIPEPVTVHYPSAGEDDGTTLPDLGWTLIGAKNNLQVQDDIWNFTENYFNEGGWVIALTSSDQEVGFTQVIASGMGGDTNATSYNLRVNHTDEDNHISLDGSNVLGAHVYVVIGGVGTDLTPGAYTLHPPGGTLALRRIGATVYVLLDGEIYPPGENPRKTSDNGLDISDLVGDLPASSTVAIKNLGFNFDPPLVTASDIYTSYYPTALIQITSATFTEPTFDHNYVNLELVGTAPGVTEYMLGWWDAEGQPIAVSGPYAVTSGAFDTENIETPDVVLATDCSIIVWDASDPATFGYRSVSAPAYPLLNAAIPGHQLGDVANWSEETYVFRDQAYLARWTCYVGGPDPWQPPLPDGSLPDGATEFNLVCAESARIGYGMDTQWTVLWPDVAGFTVTAPGGGFAQDIASFSCDSGARVAHFTPLADGRPLFELVFTPTAGQRVPMDIPSKIGIARDADTATGPIADLALEAFIPGTIFRTMKVQRVEEPYVVDGDAPGGLVTPSNAQPARLGEMYVQTGTLPHVCIPVNASAEYVEWWATEFKAAVPPGVTINHTRFNELFNYVYAYNLTEAMTRACSGGFIADVPAGSYVNHAANNDPGKWDFDLDTHEAKVFIPAGQHFYANIGSHGAYLALEDIDIGDVLPGSTNSQVQVLNNNYAQMFMGAYKRQLWDVRQDHIIFKAVFGDRNPIMDCWENFQLQSVSDVLEIMTYEVEGQPIGRGLKLFGGSHYTSTSWNWEVSPPAAMIGFNDDEAAFQEWIHTTFVDGVTGVGGTLPTIKAQWQGVYAGLRALGWGDEEIPRYITYEGNYNFDVSNVPDIYTNPSDPGFIASFPDAVQTAFLQPQMYDDQLAFQQGLTALGLYGFVNFQLHARIGAGGGTVRTWQFMRRVNSQNDPSGVDQNWKAYADNCAAVLS